MRTLATAARSLRRPFAGAAVAALALSGLAMVTASPASALTNAVSTSTNVDAGTGACLHGNTNGGTQDVVNCNQYAEKKDVWLSNLPTSLPAGETYFFAVIEPGSQHDPNDGADGNLSDTTATSPTDLGSGDAKADRTFTTNSNGQVVPVATSTHAISGGKVQLIPYDDTSNPGGVYILAVCQYDDGNAVDPHQCKYDAFKVDTGDDGGECQPTSYVPCDPPPTIEGKPLTVSKTAAGVFDRNYTWDVEKSITGGPTYGATTAHIDYRLDVDRTAGAATSPDVTGVISVGNTNSSAIPGVTVSDLVTVTHADSTTSPVSCTLSGGTLVDDGLGGYEVPAGGGTIDYACDLTGAWAEGDALSNRVDITWGDYAWNDGTSDYFLSQGAANSVVTPITMTESSTNECADLTDKLGAQAADNLGMNCGDVTVTYGRDITIPSQGCVTVDNTATITPTEGGPADSDSASAQVCRPYQSLGARTMGFWQNKNGQGIIKGGGSTGGVCNAATWLRTLNPFKDLSSTATCTATATYVYNRVKEASAAGATMNKMLKGQMLATALDVYYTGAGKYAGAQAFLPSTPIGSASVDLLHVCTDIAACTTFQNTSGAFNNLPSATVSQLLSIASSYSTSGGATWYAQNKTTQGKAKNTFDAINNNVTYAP
jgi:hypothetical protein